MDDVFAALAYRSYLPGAAPAPKVAPPLPQPPVAPSSGSRYPAALSGAASAFAPQSGSRKRSYHDLGDAESRAVSGDRGGFGGRATKQPRRHGYGGAPSAFNNGAPAGLFQNHAFPPAALPSAELEYDPMPLMPNMDALLSGFHAPPPGGFPPGAPHFSAPAKGQVSRRRRCRDYDAQGFCTRGSTCQYEHVPSVGYSAAASAAQSQFGGEEIHPEAPSPGEGRHLLTNQSWSCRIRPYKLIITSPRRAGLYASAIARLPVFRCR